MIFVTLGTTKFPFNRLVTEVDNALLKTDSKEKLIIQGVGRNRYSLRYSNHTIYEDIPFTEEVSLLTKSRIVIAHGGLATVFLCSYYCKNIPLIVPRNSKFKEHVNNHQISFTKNLQKKGKLKKVIYTDGLSSKITSYLKNPVINKSFRKFSYSNSQKQLIERLTEYTNRLNCSL